MNTDALLALRTQRQAKVDARPTWRSPVLGDFRHDRVIAFDQSLAACGVVMLTSDDTGLTILDAQVMHVPTTDATRSREHHLRRALLLTDEIAGWYRRTVSDTGWSVVYEAVPEGGSIRAPESSLLAAMAVRVASRRFPEVTSVLEPVPAQTHKKFICGNRNASKAEHHRALMTLVPALSVRGLDQLTNEAKRDAFSVALYALRKTDG